MINVYFPPSWSAVHCVRWLAIRNQHAGHFLSMDFNTGGWVWAYGHPGTYEIGFTVHGRRGGRAVYHPDWDATLPWACYYTNGNAAVHRGSLSAAMQWLDR